MLPFRSFLQHNFDEVHKRVSEILVFKPFECYQIVGTVMRSKNKDKGNIRHIHILLKRWRVDAMMQKLKYEPHDQRFLFRRYEKPKWSFKIVQRSLKTC